MPDFPEINKELTRERALNMILASIAMEELALSHIMNAEGEKLQYVLESQKNKCGSERDTDEILCVNKSVTSLLEIASQNQMVLKNKMEKVLQFMSHENCRHDVPPDRCRSFICSALFKGAVKCDVWRAGCTLPWNCGDIKGKCVRRDSCNSSKILMEKGRYLVSFAINAKSKNHCRSAVEICLQMCGAGRCTDLFTFNDNILFDGETVTISMGGLIADNSEYHGESYLRLCLVSPEQLIVEDSMLSIVDIGSA